MSGYEITFSITAVCSCCGNDLPSSSYLTVSKPSGHPLDRDNPYERKDRRVFITPCGDCFEWKQRPDTPEVRNSQHVLKAEGGSSDATDRENCANASPDGGPMGAGQAAAAAPAVRQA